MHGDDICLANSSSGTVYRHPLEQNIHFSCHKPGSRMCRFGRDKCEMASITFFWSGAGLTLNDPFKYRFPANKRTKWAQLSRYYLSMLFYKVIFDYRRPQHALTPVLSLRRVPNLIAVGVDFAYSTG